MGVMTGIRKESGILDNSPLIAYLHNIFTEYNYDLKRKVVFSCADANRGIYVTFNETNPDPIKAIISSASIPFAFPHQFWNESGAEDVVCMDGGTMYNENLVSAVTRCREQVEHDSQITIDIIVCSAH